MSSAKPRNAYVFVSDTQRAILQEYFNNKGMTSTRKAIMPVIRQAVEETGLDEERIKVYSCNNLIKLIYQLILTTVKDIFDVCLSSFALKI